jgi:hypothetical protein
MRQQTMQCDLAELHIPIVFWSDQAFLSGKSVADKIKLKIDSYEG